MYFNYYSCLHDRNTVRVKNGEDCQFISSKNIKNKVDKSLIAGKRPCDVGTGYRKTTSLYTARALVTNHRQ